LVAAGACGLSFLQSKDRTGLANTSSVVTVLVLAVAAIATESWSGLLPALVGTGIVYIGNKQLAAGTRSG
jgi:hypothetical protein